jgi:uncharacterized protein
MNRVSIFLFDLPKKTLIVLVKMYRIFLSPIFVSSCRFTPTCSAYAMQALAEHGAIAGSYLTVSRVLRCHPWCLGGIDLVPTRDSKVKLLSKKYPKKPLP